MGFAIGIGISPTLGQGGGVRPSNNIVAVDGDSRGIIGVTSPSFFTRCIISQLRMLSRQRIDTKIALNYAHSGDTSADVAARIATTIAGMQAANAKTLFLIGPGTNDLGTLTLLQSTTNIGAILNAAIAAGIVVVALAEMPRDDVVGANLTQLQGIRDYYLSRHNPGRGIYIVNPWTALADASNRVADQIHQSVKGALNTATAMLATVQSLFSPVSLLPEDNTEYTSGGLAVGVNILTNALMSGGATVATSWAVTNNAAGTVAVTSSKVTTGTGDWQQVAITGTPSGGGELFVRLEQAQDARASLFANGDVLDAMIEIEVDAGNTGCRSLELVVVSDTQVLDGGYDNGNTVAAYQLSGDAYAGILRIPPYTFTGTPTFIRLRLRAVGLTGVPMAITFRARKAKICKRTAL